MTTYTATDFLASTRFIEIAAEGAIKQLAKTHKTTVAAIKRHLADSSKLQHQMAELIHAAAEESAKRMSK